MRGSTVQRANRWYAVYEQPTGADGIRRKKWEGAGTTRKSAETLLTKRLAEIESGGYVEPSTLKLASFLGDWLETAAKPRLRPASFSDYESCIRLHVNPILGAMPLGKLTPMDVQKAYTALSKKGLSAHRIHRVHRVLSSALRCH